MKLIGESFIFGFTHRYRDVPGAQNWTSRGSIATHIIVAVWLSTPLACAKFQFVSGMGRELIRESCLGSSILLSTTYLGLLGCPTELACAQCPQLDVNRQ